ncbi:hypothetical protein DdX_18635 [Ditylenchus destructor]|uniref:Uncharacterized protein n=1 Tax=Ditylenchus destructor TaxID=166010 RepID=A0AAD4MJV3_9BILA|nr:hypothetical protein DdX_18635 [Ditylenchus destructor]
MCVWLTWTSDAKFEQYFPIYNVQNGYVTNQQRSVIKVFKNLFKNHVPAVIKMFNEELSPEEYNKFIARNGYSKQVPLEGRIAGKESTENVRDNYDFWAEIKIFAMTSPRPYSLPQM